MQESETPNNVSRESPDSESVNNGLHVKSLSVEVDGALILEDVSIHVSFGSTVAVVGPSGIGKSTLLRTIAGIVSPTSGSISIDGRDVTNLPAHRRNVGMVFQDDQLFSHLTVAQNIAFGLDMQRSLLSRAWMTPKSLRRLRIEKSERIAELLELVGLSDFAHRRTPTLSGGEAKRVALARALAPTPAVLLLDEPLTGLDQELHDRLMRDLKDILRATSTTTVLVTHDLAEANYLAETTVRLIPPSSSTIGHR
jgi:thiamine transport system ATP-binding protein